MSFYFKDGKKGDSWKEKEEDFNLFYLKMNSYFSIEITICSHKMVQIIVLQRTALEETDSINFLSVDDPQKLPKDQQDGKKIKQIIKLTACEQENR